MSENPIFSKWKSCKSAFGFGSGGEDGYELREKGYIGIGCEQPQVVKQSANTQFMNDGPSLVRVAILHPTAKSNELSVIETLLLTCQDCCFFNKKD